MNTQFIDEAQRQEGIYSRSHRVTSQVCWIPNLLSITLATLTSHPKTSKGQCLCVVGRTSTGGPQDCSQFMWLGEFTQWESYIHGCRNWLRNRPGQSLWILGLLLELLGKDALFLLGLLAARLLPWSCWRHPGHSAGKGLLDTEANLGGSGAKAGRETNFWQYPLSLWIQSCLHMFLLKHTTLNTQLITFQSSPFCFWTETHLLELTLISLALPILEAAKGPNGKWIWFQIPTLAFTLQISI